ncbi:LysM peptidoglycan-binding domain-containing protein [Halomonas sp. 7T]|uniref:FimV/HubP family polar landmark protein n=1 Tax=Halomonas sp. 7T TaxID=2893469 RepID=UPI0021DA53A2|nr:FimV/HubP family polar landmark protein [Halomonas sp. 7T]UXZ55867.1 LysM peptidoglycan-binding domain-containing protein [Halomonas sp. 7T]
MKQTHTWLLWLPLSAVSSLALAVGLGPASVNSPLDAPLNATVPVLDASQYALDELRVSVADEADFTAAGLEWTPLISSLRVQLREQADGRQLVLSSSQVVDDPWLDVLLTIDSPGGEATRAFTLLFDPPNMVNARSPSREQQEVALPNRQPASATPGVPNDGSTSLANNTAYVASGDTLWSVADRVRPANASVQQMIVALVDANPRVFPSSNINNLRAGQTLIMPSREQVMARSPGEAARAVQAMRRTSEQPPSSQQADTPPAETAAEIAQEEPNQSADEGAGGGADESATATEPATEPLDAEQAQNPESALADLTLDDVIQQLAESQAMLQQVLEERAQLRMELAELRQEVAALTEALNASQQGSSAANAVATGLLEGARGEQNQGGAPESAVNQRSVFAPLAEYRWPLASIALALLLAGLVWSRKRRERQWEDAPVTARSVTPPSAPSSAATAAGRTEPHVAESTGAATSGARQAEAPFAEAASVEPVTDFPSAASSSSESQVAEPGLDTAAFDEAPVMKPSTAASNEPPPTVNDSEAPKEWEADDDDVFTRSQASGLAAQRQQPKPDSHEQVSLAPSAVKPEASALDDSHHVDEQEHPQERVEDEMSPPDEDQRSQPLDYYIDYNPPSLKHEETSEEGAINNGVNNGTTTSSKRANYTPRVPEDEWEIEEVAFEPRRRDNS